MVTKTKTETENKLTLKSLGVIVSVVLGVLSSLAGGFVFIDARYVHQDIYDIYVEQTEKDFLNLEQKTAQLFIATQKEQTHKYNQLQQDIKSASALPLIIKRDLLLTYTNRTDREKAELALIQQKLTDLNIQ